MVERIVIVTASSGLSFNVVSVCLFAKNIARLMPPRKMYSGHSSALLAERPRLRVPRRLFAYRLGNDMVGRSDAYNPIGREDTEMGVQLGAVAR